MTTNRWRTSVLPVAASCLVVTAAAAKETHFEEVKFRLVSEHIRCTHCHAGREDPELTAYGRKISDLGKDKTVQERVKELEAEVAVTASEEEREAAKAHTDVDADGVANWIEILTGRDPSAAEDSQQPAAGFPTVERVTTFVQCTICHIRVDAVAGPGKSRAPHNPFGKTLTEFDAKGKRLRGRAIEKADAEDVDFAQRLDVIAKEDADLDSAFNWDEISSLHSPFDKTDRPTLAETKALRQNQADRRKNDEGFGQIHKLPHRPRRPR